MNMTTTADRIKEAANKCPQAAATLKTLFPEVFNDGVYKFGDSITIRDEYITDSPIFIGDNLAPEELRLSCLIVKEEYVCEMSVHDGYQILTFKRKP